MAITDELTQLYNRRYFHTSLDAEISRAKRYAHSISLLILDIDHFKQVNDNHGHQIGDQVLSELGTTITSITRENDIVARYGGEEFAIILPEAELPEACDCAEKIRKAIEKKGFILEDGSFLNLTTSIGVASAGRIKIPVKDVAENIIKLADQALYKAKESGRNRVITQGSDHP
jgi:diguanylate cyclase (GGDEF)-like protein